MRAGVVVAENLFKQLHCLIGFKGGKRALIGIRPENTAVCLNLRLGYIVICGKNCFYAVSLGKRRILHGV